MNIELDKLSLVAKKTDNYVIITDKDDKIEWVNEGFTRITGFQLEDVIGRASSVILRSTGTDPNVAKKIEEMIKTKKPFTSELLNYNKKSEPVWLYINVTPVLNDTGEVIRYITVGSDITERKKAEEKIKKQNIELEKLSIVARETDSGVIIADPKGNIEYVNYGFTRLAGYTFEEFKEVYGTTIQEISSNPEIEKVLSDIVKNKKSANYESFHINRSGEKKWTYATLNPVFGKTGELKNIVIVYNDITELKKAEESIREKNKEITDSIKYAKKIQEAILTSSEYFQKILPQHFILFKPKDIVCGDFYWAYSLHDNNAIWTVADCTGHGVPGAFMSMIGSSLLDEIIIEKGITIANDILNELKAHIIKALGQTGATGEAKDGMDAALCIWHKDTNKLEFAGANNPLFLVRKNIAGSDIAKNDKVEFFGTDLAEFRADRQPIGYHDSNDAPFTQHEIQLQTDDTIYLFSDGYADQFGGEKEKKFTYKRFKELLLTITEKTMQEQKEILDETLEKWRGIQDQTDDICIIGVRI
ncbi:MAG: PAS domain-containing protein [Bacteroidia bacterium]|nr:PAS domain-containing protein [Bacteroidia bacterium]